VKETTNFVKKTKTQATILPNCEKNPPNFSKEQKDPQISRSPHQKNSPSIIRSREKKMP
jgi:hypothetical protein